MLADIATGNTEWADALFALAVVLFIAAALLDYERARAVAHTAETGPVYHREAFALLCLGLASTAGAWLAL